MSPVQDSLGHRDKQCGISA